MVWRHTPVMQCFRQLPSLTFSLKWSGSKQQVMAGARYASGLRLWRSSISHGGGCRWLGLRGCLPLGGHPVWMPPVAGVWNSREASNSPGWGHGHGGECWSPMGLPLPRPGKLWRPQMPSWTACWWRHMVVDCPQKTSHLLAWKSSWSARGTSEGWLMLQQWWKHGPAGSQEAPDGWIHARTIHQGLKLGPTLRLVRKGLWQDGWKILGRPVDLCQPPVSGAVVWLPNGVAVAAEINATIAWGEKGLTHAAGRHPKVRPRGNRPGGDFFWKMACLLAGAASLCGATPAQCGDDEEASASSRTALNASELVMSARVKEWRAQHSMENDDDFAYAFASYDQAVVAGGHGLATEWLEVRAEQEEHLVPAAAAVVAALKPGAPSRVLANAPKPVTKPLSRSRRRGVRLHENPGSSPQAVTHRVEVLADVLLGLGALRPSGQLSHGLQQEWSQACRRLSQTLVTQAETITVTNAVKTYQELQAHMSSRGRRGYPEFLDLDSFLHCGTATLAPCRALNSIKWLNNNAQLNWEVNGLTAPTAKSKREEKSQQAIVVAPPMMGYLEEQIEHLHNLGDHRWTALLSSWLMAVGCLRHIHLTRTRPRRLSKSTLHCSCSRGKQRRLRHGFHFCIPSYFTTGWAWAENWLKAYEKLAADVKPKAGLCFDSQGVPWAIKEVTLIAREVFYGQVDNVEWLTTYSWRRWGSTVAHTIKLSDSELAALGDWQNQTDLCQEAKMPLHYSGARYTQSQRVKHRVLEAAKHLAGFESWEMVTEEAAVQAKEVGRRAVDEAIHQDRAVLWSLPITQEEARERFSLASALKARAAKLWGMKQPNPRLFDPCLMKFKEKSS